MSKNNESRTKFSEYVDMYNLDRKDKRNIFTVQDKNGQDYNIAYSVSDDEIVVRQFYDDCHAVICNVSGQFYVAERSDMTIDQAVNRIQPGTFVEARTAKVETTNLQAHPNFGTAFSTLKGII